MKLNKPSCLVVEKCTRSDVRDSVGRCVRLRKLSTRCETTARGRDFDRRGDGFPHPGSLKKPGFDGDGDGVEHSDRSVDTAASAARREPHKSSVGDARVAFESFTYRPPSSASRCRFRLFINHHPRLYPLPLTTRCRARTSPPSSWPPAQPPRPAPSLIFFGLRDFRVKLTERSTNPPGFTHFTPSHAKIKRRTRFRPASA